MSPRGNCVLFALTFIGLILGGYFANEASKVRVADRLINDKICQLVVKGEYISTAGPKYNCYKKVM